MSLADLDQIAAGWEGDAREIRIVFERVREVCSSGLRAGGRARMREGLRLRLVMDEDAVPPLDEEDEP